MFVNPTYEEVFEMINIEAIACGTPVVTYNSGGSPETIGNNGMIVNIGKIDEFKSGFGYLFCEIVSIGNDVVFDKIITNMEYINVYCE